MNLYSRWKEEVIRLSPDVLGILVGAEFADNTSIPAAQYEAVYRLRSQDVRAALADIRFVVHELSVLPAGEVPKHWAE